jgi:hypothetical protein
MVTPALRLPLLLVALATCALCSTQSQPTDAPIRIVRSKSATKSPVVATYEPVAPVGSRPPAPFSGPEQYASLVGSCFGTNVKGYFYQLCPFQNVTQKEVASHRHRFWGLLGIWGRWRTVDGTVVSMTYNDGTPCPGGAKRAIDVELKCSTDGTTTISGVDEPKTCEYVMSLSCPQACGPHLANSPAWNNATLVTGTSSVSSVPGSAAGDTDAAGSPSALGAPSVLAQGTVGLPGTVAQAPSHTTAVTTPASAAASATAGAARASQASASPQLCADPSQVCPAGNGHARLDNIRRAVEVRQCREAPNIPPPTHTHTHTHSHRHAHAQARTRLPFLSSWATPWVFFAFRGAKSVSSAGYRQTYVPATHAARA